MQHISPTIQHRGFLFIPSCLFFQKRESHRYDEVLMTSDGVESLAFIEEHI